MILHRGWRFAAVLLGILGSSVKAVPLDTAERTPALEPTARACFVLVMVIVSLVTLRQECVTASTIPRARIVRGAARASMETAPPVPAQTVSHVRAPEGPAALWYLALRRWCVRTAL